MTALQIWIQANENRELIRSIYHTLCEDGDIDDGMNQLKQRIPCLFGVDFEQRALVFQSTDEGLAALRVKDLGDTFALALTTNIMLEAQKDAGMGMRGPEI